MPGYAEFRIGDFQHELGIVDSRYASDGTVNGPAGAIVFWHVDDFQETLNRLISMGAQIYQPITDRSHGFVTAATVPDVEYEGSPTQYA